MNRARLVAGLVAAALTATAGGLALGAVDGSGWLPVEVVARTPEVSSDPAVAVAADGAGWVVWQDGGDVLVARDSGTGWTTPERVGAGFGADIAVAGAVPHVVFVSDLADQLDLVYSYREPDGWALPRTVSSTVSLGAGPALAMAGETRLLVWSDSGYLMMARSGDGELWSVQPVLINGLPVAGVAPDVVGDAFGGVDLAWHVAVDGVERVRHAEWYGGRWSLAEDLSGPGEAPARSPSLALLPDGDRLVTWLADPGPEQRSVLATAGGTGWWSPPIELSQGASPGGPPQAAGHAAGADVAWLAAAGGARFRAYRSEGGWLPEEAVTSDVAADLALASAPGVALVGWSAPEGTDGWDIALRRRTELLSATPTPWPSPPTASATATVGLPTATDTGVPGGTLSPSATPDASVTPSAPATTAVASPVGTVALTPTPAHTTTPTTTATRSPAPSASATPSFTPRPTTPPRPSPTATAPPSVTGTPARRPVYLPWLTVRRGGRTGLVGAGPAAWSGGPAPRGGVARPAAATAVNPPERWSVPEVVVRLPAASWHLTLALDGRGRPHILWEDGAALRHSARLGAHWDEARHVAYGEAPSLALDAQGNLHALFANAFDDNQDIYFISYRDGEWSLPENVSGTDSYSTAPVLRTGDATAGLVATWAELSATGPLVYYAWWDGRWHFQPVSQARGQGPTVAVDEAGPVLAWHAQTIASRPFDIYASRGQDIRGRAWALPENVSDTTDEDSVVASVALDPGTWHVAWNEGPATAVGVAYARRFGAGWGEVEMLDPVSSGPPQMLAAPGGAREVVWLNEPALWSARGFGLEAGWRKATVPAIDVGATAVAAVTGPDGSLHLAWAETAEGGSAAIRYARRLGCGGCRALVPLALKPR